PLGVKEVINPLRASGGADKESRDQVRKNARLAIKALDRLVSVQDYEDFARTYAGVGKARAVEISDGRRQLVHVTIAGADDIPIDKNSDLYRNLRQTLLDFGDPYQTLQLEIRELMLIIIEARLRILPDYQWEPVVTQVRTALLDFFSFERRELGQDVLLSEMLSVMQGVRGVAYVDVDAFGGIPEKAVKEVEETIGGQKVKVRKRLLLTPQEIAEETNKLVVKSIKTQRPETRIQVNLADFEEKVLRPAQLAFLTPEVPATLILNQII
ncbi:MAG: baseplate J/gp47 family protein, partial [bacterium]